MTYTDMKDSGVPWIDKLPVDWKLVPLKYVVYCNQDVLPETTEDEYQFFYIDIGSVENGKGITHYEPMTFKNAPSRARRIVQTGDVIISTVRTYLKAVAAISESEKPQIVSTGFAVLREKNIQSNFLYYAVLSENFIQLIEANSVGISYPAINTGKLVQIKIPVPPSTEQMQIATYLDDKCKCIDAAIAEAKAIIEEYRCWKASVICHAVTKGLRPHIYLKESGLSWIGVIPNHWRSTNIGRFVSIRSGLTLGKQYPEGTELVARPYLRVANVKADRFVLDDVTTILVTPDEAEKYALHPGELLMTEGGDRDKLGRGTIWNGEITPCLHQNHVFAVKVNEKWMLTKFLEYVIASPVGRTYFDLTAKKTTNLASTNSSTILQFKVPIPPVEEQREIIEWLNLRCAKIDAIIQEKESLIADLESYKKSLIYEAVTGKRKVV